MEYITVNEFKKRKYLDGVYVFTDIDGCTLCKRYVDSLKTNYNIKDWVIVEVQPNELDNFREENDMRGFPLTTLYNDNEVIWQKYGALFNLQMRQLNKLMKEYSKDSVIELHKHGEIPDLEYKIAIKKPIPVKCYKMEKHFQVETLEGLMKGKPGDWLMIGIDGEMYPCDGEIFEKTYDIQE